MGLKRHLGSVLVLQGEVNFSLNKCLKSPRLKGTGVNYRWGKLITFLATDPDGSIQQKAK